MIVVEVTVTVVSVIKCMMKQQKSSFFHVQGVFTNTTIKFSRKKMFLVHVHKLKK